MRPMEQVVKTALGRFIRSNNLPLWKSLYIRR